MTDERIESSRPIRATRHEIFQVLRDPKGHVAIDASGSLMSSDADPVSAVGDRFVIHMDREAIGDIPIGLYDVEVEIVRFEPDLEIAWTVHGATLNPPIGHVYGYRLDGGDEGDEGDEGETLVTSYCDWSGIDDAYRGRISFPIIPESSLRATLGILARTVQR
jgi:hypothetical protein